MNTLFRSYLIFFFCFTATLISGQEICDDGIDNDNDGLVDLNDTEDCSCETLMPSSLIPNPSFEEMTCCPRFEGQLDCAVSWIQASAATSDYVHTCGILGNPSLQSRPPLPFPDGDGGVGFRDGKPNRPNNKEYVGSCLTETMKQGVTYRMDFFVGFYDAPSSVYLPMAFFGTNNCNNLPFGGNDFQYGCPTNGPGWDLIGEVDVRGNNEWVNVVFDFTPTQDYNAIVLGPGCAPHPDASNNPYFYVDRLALAEASEFAIPLANISGDPCDDTLILEAEPGQLSYQWYLDGVAIVGETGTELSITSQSEEGNYIVNIETPNGCSLSEPYQLSFIPEETITKIEICDGDSYPLGQQILTATGEYSETFEIGPGCDSISTIDLTVISTIETFNSETICEGDTYPLGQQMLSSTGNYSEIFSSIIGCDSTSNIDLIVLPNTESIISQTICSGDTIEIAEQFYSEQGMYSAVIENTNGCDSTINIDLTIETPIQELTIDSILTINLGDSISLTPMSVSNDIVRYEWYDADNLISTEESITVLPFTDNTYRIIAYTITDCGLEKRVSVMVNINDEIYVPNVFSPAASNNQVFEIGTGSSITIINSLTIYDRWGNIVHTYSGTESDYSGWNGTYNNSLVEIGVYTYVLKVGLINNDEILKAGNITILR